MALAFGLSGSRAAAEELAQDAFLALLRSWDKVSGYSDPAAWVRRVVVNRSVDDIAEILGCAAATVKVHLHGARAALAQSLGESSEETG